MALRGCLAVAILVRALAFAGGDRPCSNGFKIPAKPPELTTEYNGVQLEDVCISAAGPYHVFALGDWGGILLKDTFLVPADRRSVLFPAFMRQFVHGVDDKAQFRVAEQMKAVAQIAPPDYVLNLGDMFYWQGVQGTCGGPVVVDQMSSQFQKVFENVYNGPLASTPFLGVLGNHDYGGDVFSSAWQQTIGYTWGGNLPRPRRWLMPALYWSQRVRYPGFSVDYYFVDTNAADGTLCGPQSVGCGMQGPPSPGLCHSWFANLWSSQLHWLVSRLNLNSDSTHQIVVAHHPPSTFSEEWNCLADRFGIDLFVCGHEHVQRVHGGTDPGNPLKGGTCTVISGGGGGITSESTPSIYGADDMYGFMDLKLAAEYITVNAISHGGMLRSQTKCWKRNPNPGAQCAGAAARRLLGQEARPEGNLTTFV